MRTRACDAGLPRRRYPPLRRASLGAATLAAVCAVALLASGNATASPAIQASSLATQTFSAVADSYVSQKFAATNYGKKTAMRVASSPLERGYIRFDVIGVSGTVTRATLRLYSSSSSSAGVEARATASTWGETTITYNTAPPPAATATAAAPLSNSTWVSLDVTPLVAGNGSVSVAVTTTSRTSLSLAAREYGASFAPQLVVESTSPDSAPVNTSPPTITGTAQQGQTLTAAVGSWTGTAPIAYAYEWRRCDAAGAACTAIAGATGTSYTLASADVGSTIRVAVTASNGAGSAMAVSAPTAIVSATPVASDPVVMAAGDIACGTSTTGAACRQMATSDLLVNGNPDAVLALGDNQYECGALADFQTFYDPSWGRVKAKTYPIPGNHEYNWSTDPTNPCHQTTGAPGYFSYFGAAASPQEPGCLVNCKGYYSFDVGAWHVVALNSNCDYVGGCGAGSPQEQWLRQDLAASAGSCTLAYSHHPLFTSGKYRPGIASVKPLFQALYDYGVDVLLAGHDHIYERFAPQDPNGSLDLARGIREFVVGTGGKALFGSVVAGANSEIRNPNVFGVLKLTLHPASFDWEFVPEAGQAFRDSGKDACDGTAPDTSAPTVPAGFTATAKGATIADLSWQASSDDVGVVAYEIHRDGALLATVPPATSYTDTTVASTTTYEYQVKARDAAGNVSASQKATVTTLSGSTLVFAPEADARVDEEFPATNYATSTLRVNAGSEPDLESYLRFAVSGGSGAVTSAKLRVYAITGTVDGPAVFAAENGWMETGITWSTRPPATSAGLADKAGVPAASWVEYDVTPLVAGNGTFTFALKGTSTDGIEFNSREATSLRPELVVTFA